MQKKIVKLLLISALFALTINISTVHALPNKIWVGSAVTGVWESSPKTPLADSS